MSRIAKNPIAVPSGVEINLAANQLKVKGGKGELSMAINPAVEVKFEDGQLTFAPAGQAENGWAQAGTARAVANNLVRGVTEGFEKKLQLVGVGYRAQAQGKKLNLSLGFSHPVEYELPEGITAETPSQTEIVIKGIDKQRVGQVSA